MAITHKLVYGDSEIDLASADGIYVRPEYVPAVAQPTGDGSIPDYVLETLPVIINAADEDSLASILQDLHEAQRYAAEYWADTQQTTPVWYHQKQDGETGERRALVKSISFTPDVSWFTPPGSYESFGGTILIERHPYWEATTPRAFPHDTSISAGVVTLYDYTASGADILGDVGARIEDFPIELATLDPIGRFWIGLRSAARHGNVANFITTWEIEDGVLNEGESGIYVNMSRYASPGGDSGAAVVVSEVDAEWDNTWNYVVTGLTLGNVTTNYSDNYGRYLWLLRARVTSGTWEIQLRYGYVYMSDDEYQRGRVVEINSTDWDLYETDVMPIPMRNLQTIPTEILDAAHDSTWEIQIYAQRTSGSGNLVLDALFPIPIDEGYCFLKDFSRDEYYVSIHTGPTDEIGAVITDGDSIDFIPAVAAHGWYLPPGDGRMIIAWARSNSSMFTDRLEAIAYRNGAPAGTYYERWLSLRGAE